MAHPRLPRLHGRDEDVTVFRQHLDRLRRGDGGIIYLSGDPGIGKSALLDLLLKESAEGEVISVRGIASDYHEESPFALLRDAIEPYLRDLSSGRRAELAGASAPYLAIPFRSVFGEAFRPDIAADPEKRHEVYWAVASLLERIAGEHALVMVLDDIHGADSGSMELLLHLVAHYPHVPLLTVLASRPAASFRDPKLGSALRERARRSGATLLDLQGLAEGAATAFVRSLLPARADEWDSVLQLAQGNPFFLDELAKHVRRGSRLVHGPEGVVADLPVPIQDALANQHARLSPPARLLLQGAAIVGRRFHKEAAAAAADLDEATSRQAIDELRSADTVREANSAGEFRFRHQLVHAYVHTCTDPAWKRRAHGRLVPYLRANAASADVLAPHVAASAMPGNDDAIDVLVEAAVAAATHRPAAAARWYSDALRLLDDAAHRDQQIQLRIATAMALANSGDLSAAVPLLDQAAYLTSDQGTRSFCVTFSAAFEHLLGKHDQAQSRLRAAYDALPSDAYRDRAALGIEIAAGWGWTASSTQAVAAAAEARTAAEHESDLGALAAAAEALHAYALLQKGTGVPDAVDRAARLVADLSDAELVANPSLTMYVAWSLVQYERFAEAVRLCDRAVDTARVLGREAFLNGTRTARVCGLIGQGRLGEAKSALEWLIGSMETAPQVFLVQVKGLACLVATYLGDDLDAAVMLGRDAMDRARSQPGGVLPAAAAVYLGAALVEAGRGAEAKAVIEEFAAPEDLSRLLRSSRVLAIEVLVRAELAQGRGAQSARRWLRLHPAHAPSTVQLPSEHAVWARAEARVLMAESRHEEAYKIARLAAEGAFAAAPLEAALCAEVSADAAIQAGAIEHANHLLQQAEERFHQTGAHRLRRRVAQKLKDLDDTRELTRPRRAYLECRGAMWRVGFEAEVVSIEHVEGLAEIVSLISRPRQMISSRELASAVPDLQTASINRRIQRARTAVRDAAPELGNHLFSYVNYAKGQHWYDPPDGHIEWMT